MHCHANAALTPRGRARVFETVARGRARGVPYLVPRGARVVHRRRRPPHHRRRQRSAGITVSAACLAFGFSRRFYYRWLPRWQAERHAGLSERSCRPYSPQRLSVLQEARIGALRRATGWGADRLGGLARAGAVPIKARLDGWWEVGEAPGDAVGEVLEAGPTLSVA